MQYVNYETNIVIRYGVELVGWTHPKWANPSELSTSLGPLQVLLDAIDSGSCKFVKLTRDQQKQREAAYNAKLKSGEVTQRARKPRKDLGKKRKRVVEPSGSSSSSSDSDSSPSKRRRVAANVEGRPTVGGKMPKPSILEKEAQHGVGKGKSRAVVAGSELDDDDSSDSDNSD
jgi:hypothetical protein